MTARQINDPQPTRTKICVICGNEFRRGKETNAKWEARLYCSNRCVGKGKQPLASVEERFWAKVERGPACWEWRGARTSKGYGHLSRGGRGNGNVKATSLSWQIHFGPVPEGLSLLHKCDNRGCVNPDHLFLGTHAENMADMARKGRAKPASLPGESNPAAKLTAEQVATIRNDNRPHQAIARDYGVSKTAVGDIKRGRTWKE